MKKKYPELTKREALILAWEKRKDFKGYDKSKGSLFNSWRSKVYTEKGKNIGFPEGWKTFDGFVKDVGEGWEKGMILTRIDTTLPYSKENCHWTSKSDPNLNKLIKFEFNGETKYLFEWCIEFGLFYNGVIQRYFTAKNYTKEEILFGKIKKRRREVKGVEEIENTQQIRDKLSKMMSSYRNKDIKKGLGFDLDLQFLIDMTRKECVYCGKTEKVGLDRIDNSIGHLKDNCVPCCIRCNTTRNDNYSFEEMKILGETIKLIDQKRAAL
jgi:hypothetical protein